MTRNLNSSGRGPPARGLDRQLSWAPAGVRRRFTDASAGPGRLEPSWQPASRRPHSPMLRFQVFREVHLGFNLHCGIGNLPVQGQAAEPRGPDLRLCLLGSSRWDSERNKNVLSLFRATRTTRPLLGDSCVRISLSSSGWPYLAALPVASGPLSRPGRRGSESDAA